MGLLLDDKYWATILNKLNALRPRLGTPMSTAKTKLIRKIVCEALSRLAQDADLQRDLASVRALAAQGGSSAVRTHAPEFVEQFMRVESRILKNAKVNSSAARDLLNEVQALPALASDPVHRFDRLDEKIAFCARLASDPDAPDEPHDADRSTWARVWRATKGVALVSLDAGSAGAATAFLGPSGAAAAVVVVGASVTYGVDLVNHAIRDLW